MVIAPESSSITIVSNVSDTATGIDAIAGKDITVGDVAVGIEVVTSSSVNQFTGDTATGLESSNVSASVNDGDFGIGNDFASVISRVVSDIATAIEAASIFANVSSSDTGTAVDSSSLFLTIFVSDSATGIDFVSALSRSVGDLASASDIAFHVSKSDTIATVFTLSWQQYSLSATVAVKVVTASSTSPSLTSAVNTKYVTGTRAPLKYITSDGSITIIS
jgi:hypothetical protein